MKKYIFITLGIVLVGIVLVGFLGFRAMQLDGELKQYQEGNADTEQTPEKYMTLTLRGEDVHVEVVEDARARNKGLSGRESLEKGKGMLFVFPEPDTYGFWMPDMHFAIDIIWFDENMKVVYIKENATPESYPELFKPSVPALYVLEVPSGFASKHKVKEGDQGLLR